MGDKRQWQVADACKICLKRRFNRQMELGQDGIAILNYINYELQHLNHNTDTNEKFKPTWNDNGHKYYELDNK